MRSNDNGSRKQTAFPIKCYYCREEFKVAADHPSFINKAFCNKRECVEKHFEDKKNGRKRLEKYKAHVISEKEKHKKKKKFMVVFFVDEEKKVVFRENGGGPPIRVGEIIPEERIPERLKDNDYVFVIKGFGLPGRINQ